MFIDAAAIVIFQADVEAAVSGPRVGPVVVQFALGAALAVGVGIFIGWLSALITRLVHSMMARSVVTLMVPFAAYILAD